MDKVRMTAFHLRELYEGNVRNAQLKIFNEFANGGKPYIAPGIRQLVGYDQFDVNDVKNNGFPPGCRRRLVSALVNCRAEPFSAQHRHDQGRQVFRLQSSSD